MAGPGTPGSGNPPSPPQGADRRAHPRHDVTISVRFKNDGTAATTRDVSRGGCAVIAPRMRLANERIPIELMHPAAGVLELLAEVKRSVAMPDGRWLLGVQFVDVNDALAAKITAFVAQITAVPVADDASRLGTNAAEAEKAGRLEDAARLLEKALEMEPNRGDLALARARVAFKAGETKEASKFAKKAMMLDPHNPAIGQLIQQITAKERAGAPGTIPGAPGTPDASAPAANAEQERQKKLLLALGGVLGVAVLYWLFFS